MSRALTLLMAAGAMLAGAHSASAQYYGPVDYHDAPPPRYHEERYDRYGEPRYYEERLPFLPERGYRGRPHFDDRYGYHRRRYHDGDPVSADEYFEEDLPGHHDDYGDTPLLHDDEPGALRKRDRGFDPRRPHLGDGTDAPSEQYYARRPRSCGEYYYWDGRACVDARKYPPYLGPKP